MHYYIEKYTTDNRAHAEKSMRMLPIQRQLAKIGPGGQLVKVEQTQYPNHPNDHPKRLKVCKFRDDELQMMCHKSFKEEKQQWRQI
jgi:hypothetical protein